MWPAESVERSEMWLARRVAGKCVLGSETNKRSTPIENGLAARKGLRSTGISDRTVGGYGVRENSNESFVPSGTNIPQ
jgi:hypothetical protein